MTQKQKKLAAEIRKGLKFLKRLGSKETIASYFESVGIRGRRLSARNCPVARFLAIRTSQPISVCQVQASCGNLVVRFAFPEVKSFISTFDESGFPNLLEAA